MGHLVLSRKPRESIFIGEGDDMIAVTVHRIDKRGNVKLAIDAPDNVPVNREEVWQKKENAKEQVI